LVQEVRQINDKISIGLLDLAAFSARESHATMRLAEKAGALYLLKYLLNHEPFELAYSATNKPYLKDRSEHISISHSHDMLAIICNRAENTGIDIELLRDKVQGIQHKFLYETEKAFAHNDTDRLITLWAAKESLYKVYGLKELDFKKHLFVDAFEGPGITGHIRAEHMNKSYRLVAEQTGNYKMVYVLHEL
jgi:phosphopantetheinyl transferase